jgi:hypothetical protein
MVPFIKAIGGDHARIHQQRFACPSMELKKQKHIFSSGNCRPNCHYLRGNHRRPDKCPEEALNTCSLIPSSIARRRTSGP